MGGKIREFLKEKVSVLPHENLQSSWTYQPFLNVHLSLLSMEWP